MVDIDGREVDSFSVDKNISLEKHDTKEENDDDSNSSSYDPQQVTVPLTLCVAIMVGWVINI